VELERALEKDTIYVCDVDSGKNMDPFMSFGGSDKQYVGTGPTCSVGAWLQGSARGSRLRTGRSSLSSATAASCSVARSRCGASRAISPEHGHRAQ